MILLLPLFLRAYTSAISVSYVPGNATPPPSRELSGLAYDSANQKAYIYGGRSEIIHSDMWEFDLASLRWNQMHPATTMSPGVRSNSFLTIIEGSRQIVLFGGDTESGPISDVWVYDLDSEIVRSIQWQLIETKGKAPPRAYYRTVCDYFHNGNHYIAVYGGKGRSGYLKSLNILDLDTFTWRTLSESELGPNVASHKMDYYQGSLYIYSVDSLYIYSLDTDLWTQTASSGKRNTKLIDYPQCAYEDYLYMIMGWDDATGGTNFSIFKINLTNESHEAEEIPVTNEGVADWLFGYDCVDNLVYLFGGGATDDGYLNSFSILDLDKPKLEFQILSKPLDVPTARKGHAMQTYNDKLYIFGGVDSNGNSLIDMWTYDINKENWSPISFKSSVVPSPRSEFAHARYQDDFIIFGGKGDTELFNDIYRYSTRDHEWKFVDVDTTPKPAARRAACMAAADDFILLYGGVEASGYSNELWKFEWATKSYTLLDSSNYNPKSAFSQCHIETNSYNQMIFKVYMGETEGESPIAFISEYNLSLHNWSGTLEASVNDAYGKSKAATFMIEDKLIIAGGSTWNYASFRYIKVLDLKSFEVVEVGDLPAHTYYGASVYYKNKIYIHGGGYSFGDLPLSSIVNNDLIIIHLDQQCEESQGFCISECSKGTYFKNGSCILCPKGSYSNKIGSNSCEMCKAGYFSDIIGAETSKACKPCPYGYFNIEEGQSMCMKCQSGSLCSLDEVKPDKNLEVLKYTSIQPDLLDYETETVSENSKNFYIIISMILFVCLIPLLLFSKTRNCLRKIDMYSQQHNHEENQPIYITKTLIGGIFTTGFLFAALAIIFNMFLSYAIDNIRETKGLVPLAALEQQYDNVIFIQFAAEEAKFEFEFKAYGGECGSEEGLCTEDLYINLENIKGVRQNLRCDMDEADCKVSFTIQNFDLAENGIVSIKLSEPQSLCSGISLKVETSSSIPDEVSSILDVVWSDKDRFFRGSTPTTFSYLMTPSLFRTDSDIWKDDLKGYHISIQEDANKGSQTYVSDLQYSKFLQVEVQMYKNWAVLYTQRLQVQPIGTLLSNLSGSILGILGVFGFFMGLFEGTYINYMKKRSYIQDMMRIIKNRDGIIDKNFDMKHSAVAGVRSKWNTMIPQLRGLKDETKVQPISESFLQLQVEDLE